MTPKQCPLRKVIDRRVLEYGSIKATRELLSCGHLIPCRKDAVAETKRRCAKCQLGHGKDVG